MKKTAAPETDNGPLYGRKGPDIEKDEELQFPSDVPPEQGFDVETPGQPPNREDDPSRPSDKSPSPEREPTPDTDRAKL